MIRNLLFSVFILFIVPAHSQTRASFTCANTICFGDSLKITNTSYLNKTNQWHVCTPALYRQPVVTNIGVRDSISAGHANITMVCDSNYYLFLSNQYDSGITRIRFRHSWFDTVPEVTVLSASQLGNKIFNPQGIQVRYDPFTKKWFGFVVNVDTRLNMYLRGCLARLDFGSSLDSIPKVTIIDTVQYHLMLPKGMQLEHDASGKWHLFIANANNILPLSGPEGKGYSISHYFFNDSISAKHIWNKYYAFDMGSTSALYEPQQVKILNTPAGEWYGMILNSDSRITRLTLGYTLEYWPFSEKLPVISDLTAPVDFNLFNSANSSWGLFVNGYASKGLTLIGFDSTLNSPSAVSYQPDTKFNYPVCISEMYSRNDSLICFAVNSDNSILRILFKGYCDSVVATSSLIVPEPVVLSEKGDYLIQLTINKDSVDEQTYYRKISVIDCPEAISKASVDVDVYPTRLKDVINIQFPSIESGMISVFDMNGCLMMQYELNKQDNAQLSATGLVSGMYLVKIRTDRGMVVRKIVRE